MMAATVKKMWPPSLCSVVFCQRSDNRIRKVLVPSQGGLDVDVDRAGTPCHRHSHRGGLTRPDKAPIRLAPLLPRPRQGRPHDRMPRPLLQIQPVPKRQRVRQNHRNVACIPAIHQIWFIRAYRPRQALAQLLTLCHEAVEHQRRGSRLLDSLGYGIQPVRVNHLVGTQRTAAVVQQVRVLIDDTCRDLTETGPPPPPPPPPPARRAPPPPPPPPP